MRILYWDETGELRPEVTAAQLPALVQSGKGGLWVDFAGDADALVEPLLRDVFGFHPLAIDDALRESHVPKLDDWGTYLYIVLQFPHLKPELTLETSELDLFLGRQFLVTHHDEPLPALDRVFGVMQRDKRLRQRGAVYLAYLVIDELIAQTMPIFDTIEDEVEALETILFKRPAPDTLERLFALKRALLTLRRILMPEREVLNRLARGDALIIDAEGRYLFRDIYDHLVRLNDLNENLRDLIGSALDTYLSVVNNAMNEAMKTLAVITTVFMPSSFLAGFFGMNFFAPEGTLLGVFGARELALVIGVMVSAVIGMIVWIRRRGWV